MELSVKDIAHAIGAGLVGDGNFTVSRLAEPVEAGPKDLALAMSAKYANALAGSAAQAAVLWEGADWQALGLRAGIVVSRPRLAMSGLTQAFDRGPTFEGIHPAAIIDDSARIGKGCHIGAFTIVGPNTSIGDGSWIGNHVSISGNVQIGASVIFHDGVRIAARANIGDGAILHPNVVIGADGFSFVTRDLSNEERAVASAGRIPLTAPQDATRHRIHSLGGVVIGADVEIGANSTVDAGTIRPTQVGAGTKIDNLVQVGHNVIIGADCVLCAQAAVAGSARLCDRVVLGGKSGVRDNVSVGSDVVLGGGAIVLSDVEPGQFMMGYPAQPMPEHRAAQRALRRLQQQDRTPKSSSSKGKSGENQ